MSPSPPPTAFLVLLLLVFVAVVCKETTHASALNAATSMGVSPQKMERIQRYLEKINKPAVKSIKSPDGDIIDCVLMNKQLALDHPLLKNHKIQKVAPKRPASRSKAGNQRPRNGTTRMAWQAWNHVGNCPEGTVSVRRTTVEDVLRAGSLSRFARRKFMNELLARLTRAMSCDLHATRELRHFGAMGWRDHEPPRQRATHDDPDGFGHFPQEGYRKASYFRNVKSLDGDVIYCIQIHEQPALDNPPLKDHKIKEGYPNASYFRNIEVVSSANAFYSPSSISPTMTNAIATASRSPPLAVTGRLISTTADRAETLSALNVRIQNAALPY
uniref:Neprosin activation peptide domain-containing protein n=1 Tax=Ananas comosus var. bracteatus TaxID=296719 RepID=A0A6V7PJW5_ANACO|nr:unnamed protein product [Ananas comosus var. bracteatus]